MQVLYPRVPGRPTCRTSFWMHLNRATAESSSTASDRSGTVSGQCVSKLCSRDSAFAHAGQVKQYRESSFALHKGADRRAAESDNQITLRLLSWMAHSCASRHRPYCLPPQVLPLAIMGWPKDEEV